MAGRKLTEGQVESIRADFASGEDADVLARQHDVSPHTIRNAAYGATYKNVGGPIAPVPWDAWRAERLAAASMIVATLEEHAAALRAGMTDWLRLLDVLKQVGAEALHLQAAQAWPGLTEAGLVKAVDVRALGAGP